MLGRTYLGRTYLGGTDRRPAVIVPDTTGNPRTNYGALIDGDGPVAHWRMHAAPGDASELDTIANRPLNYQGALVPNLHRNPSFEAGVAGLVVGGSGQTNTQTTDQVFAGTYAWKVLCGGTGIINAYLNSSPFNDCAVDPAKVYTFSAYVRAAAATQQFRIYVYWYDASNVQIGAPTSPGVSVYDSAGAWTRISYENVTPPVGADHCLMTVRSNAIPGAGEIHYFDAWSITQSNALLPYSDTQGVSGGDPGALLADSDTAVTFDGSTGYGSTPAPLSPDVFTLEAWVALDVTPGSTGVAFGIIACRPNLHGFYLELASSGNLTFVLYDGATGYSFGVPSLSWDLGVYYHVAATFDGTIGRLYRNGVAVGNPYTLPNTYAAALVGPTFVGRDTLAQGYLPGSIDEVAIYPYALSAARLLTHYQAGVGGGPTAQSAATLDLQAPTRLGTLSAAGQATATLVVNSPGKIVPATAAGQGGASLALQAPTQVALAGAAAAASGTLTLTTVAPISGTGAGQASASLALTAPTRLTGSAAGQGTAALALTAPTRLTASATGQAGASLALSAPTSIAATSAGQASATLALSAPTSIAATSAGQASASLALTIGGITVLLTGAVGQSAGLLALSAPTGLSLSASAASSTSLALSAPTRVTPAGAVSAGSGQLRLSAPSAIAPDPASGQAAGALTLTAAVQLAAHADGLSSATLVLSAPAVAPHLVLTAAGVASATLGLQAAALIVASSSATLGGSLMVSAASRITPTGAAAVSTGYVRLTAPTQIPLDALFANSTSGLELRTLLTLTLSPARGVGSAAFALSIPFVAHRRAQLVSGVDTSVRLASTATASEGVLLDADQSQTVVMLGGQT